MIGLIAILLAPLTILSSRLPLHSISASYYAPGWSPTIFIGALLALSALLFSYRGRSGLDTALGRLAAVAAACMALLPAECDLGEGCLEASYAVSTQRLHLFFTLALFLILAVFCLRFHRCVRRKPGPQARIRAFIYCACAATLVFAGLAIALEGVPRVQAALGDRAVFDGECLALTAFGLSWLTASRVLPLITHKDERVSLRSLLGGRT